jgi:hypothetical protein
MIKNVVTLLGRGVEGCGVTKFTVEMGKYLKKRGINNPVVALKDKTWSRKDSHQVEHLVQFKFAKDDQFKHAMDIIDQADVVIVNSLPSLQVKKTAKAHDVKAVENFMRCIEECKAPLIMIQHDHNRLSLRRNAGTNELINKARVLFAHSKTGDFAKQVSEATGTDGLAALLNETKEIKTFQPAFDFDDHSQRYWKLIEEQDPKLCRWIGRTTFWKGFVPMFDFHNNYLRRGGFCTVLEGIEKSPAFLDFKTKSVFHNLIGQDPDQTPLKKYYGDDAVVFSVFNNHAMLKRMAKTGFGFQLSLLDPKFIDRSIEYTHCEIPAVGAVPVFRKEFGDACTHRVTGNRLTADPNSGTIWLPTNAAEMNTAFETVLRLSKDSVERDEWRHKALEYYKSHQDLDGVFDDMFKDIENACRI